MVINAYSNLCSVAVWVWERMCGLRSDWINPILILKTFLSKSGSGKESNNLRFSDLEDIKYKSAITSLLENNPTANQAELCPY